jgi:hypothetical protein
MEEEPIVDKMILFSSESVRFQVHIHHGLGHDVFALGQAGLFFRFLVVHLIPLVHIQMSNLFVGDQFLENGPHPNLVFGVFARECFVKLFEKVGRFGRVDLLLFGGSMRRRWWWWWWRGRLDGRWGGGHGGGDFVLVLVAVAAVGEIRRRRRHSGRSLMGGIDERWNCCWQRRVRDCEN